MRSRTSGPVKIPAKMLPGLSERLRSRVRGWPALLGKDRPKWGKPPFGGLPNFRRFGDMQAAVDPKLTIKSLSLRCRKIKDRSKNLSIATRCSFYLRSSFLLNDLQHTTAWREGTNGWRLSFMSVI